MRYLVLTVSFAAALAVSSAVAQSTAPAAPQGTAAPREPLGLGPSNKLDVTNLVPPSELAPGDNKITDSQAILRLQNAGISDIVNLMKDEKGIWRANAKLRSRIVTVGLDYKGNISAQ
ncbi:hypothetical protein [Bosea sp. PAMC 26642]|uniref:hypothetical protein n=1 Tax=Bosea sp. (strain PAMC 26642) TaxID=1792307 RepID=UPI0007705D4A|nr:hypothetical protein [Bosea sp. PAMC 26642]AMJ62722.1 hypothetical protein AXW83_22640 [Bosea sp. PAMC 26642]